MKSFLDKDFLLESKTASALFHDYADKLPIVDYHCHIDPVEIYENKRFLWRSINVSKLLLSPAPNCSTSI